MSGLARAVLVVLLIAAAIGAYLWWFSEERQIRRLLTAVADGVSHDEPASSLGAVSAVAGLQPYFAADVTVEPGRPYGAVRGRDLLMAAAARVRVTVPALRVEFDDVQVSLAPDKRSASVNCTAIARVTDRAGQESVDARDVVIALTIVDGQWIITRAEAVEALEPITP